MRCYKMLQYVRRDCQRLCRRLEQSRWALHPVILAPGTPEMLGFVESMGPSMALQCLALWIPLVSICQYVSIEAPWSSHHHQGAAASQRERVIPAFAFSWTCQTCRSSVQNCKLMMLFLERNMSSNSLDAWKSYSCTAQLGISDSRCVDWCHRFHVSSDETQSWQFRFKSNCMYANVNGLLESLHAIR